MAKEENSKKYTLGTVKYDFATNTYKSTNTCSFEEMILHTLMANYQTYQEEGKFFIDITNKIFSIVGSITNKKTDFKDCDIAPGAILLSIYDELAISYETKLTLEDIKKYVAKIFLRQLTALYMIKFRHQLSIKDYDFVKDTVKSNLDLWLKGTNNTYLRENETDIIKFHIGRNNILAAYNEDLESIFTDAFKKINNQNYESLSALLRNKIYYQLYECGKENNLVNLAKMTAYYVNVLTNDVVFNQEFG